MIENYKKVMAILVSVIIFIAMTTQFVRYNNSTNQSLRFSEEQVSDYMEAKYATAIDTSYFTDPNTVFCDEAKNSNFLTIDCVGRKGDRVFVFGHQPAAEARAVFEEKVLSFLRESYLISDTAQHQISCVDSIPTQDAATSFQECFVTEMEAGEPSTLGKKLVASVSLYHFNTDKPIVNYVLLTPSEDSEVFTDFLEETVALQKSFSFFNTVYAGGEGGGGEGLGEEVGVIGLQGSYPNGATAVAAAGFVNPNGSVSGFTNTGNVQAALAAGMVQTGPTTACCNAAGDAVSEAEVGGGDYGGLPSDCYTNGSGAVICPVTGTPVGVPPVCPGGATPTVANQYRCYYPGGTVSAGDHDNTVSPGYSEWQGTVPTCVNHPELPAASLQTSVNYSCPVTTNASCAVTHNSCSAGTLGSTGENSLEWTWACEGVGGGIDVLCTESKPTVQPICGVARNTCDVGTLGVSGEDASKWYWGCLGSGSGGLIQCSQNKPPVLATISGTACEIANGASTCNGSLTWDIDNANLPNIYNGNGNTLSNNSTGDNVLVVLGYGLTTFYARNGSNSLSSANLLTTCVSGTSWDGTSCLPPVAPPPEVEVLIDRDLVRVGEIVQATARVTAAYPVRCTIFGVEESPVSLLHSGTPVTDSYTYPTRPLNAAQIVTATCYPEPTLHGVGEGKDEARVNVVPTITEI